MVENCNQYFHEQMRNWDWVKEMWMDDEESFEALYDPMMSTLDEEPFVDLVFNN